MYRQFSSFARIFEGFGVSSSDSDDVKLQKSFIVSTSIAISFLSIIWGSIYFFYNLPISASIPFSYTILSWLSLIYFHKSKNLVIFRNFQLFLLLFLPFFLTVSLGGFVNSSAVILWSLVAPFGALIFSDTRKAPYWFLFYLLLVITGAYFDFFNIFHQVLPIGFIHYFFILNLCIIPFMLFFMLYYFVDQKNKAFQLLKVVMNNEFSTLISNLGIENKTEDVSVLLLIIDNSGLSVYTKFFSDSHYDEQLIGGFLTALNSFSEVAFGANFLKQMNYKDFHLLFDVVSEYKLVYAFKGDLRSASLKFNDFVQKIQHKNFISIIQNRGIDVLDNNSDINSLTDSIF